MVREGCRVVYENDATSAEHASRNLWDEFHLKVRYASAGYQIVSVFRRFVLKPTSLFAFQFFSHKLLRWLAPVPILGLLVSSVLADGRLYTGVAMLQAAFYGAALLAMLVPARIRPQILYFPLYFVMGNAAALFGIVKYAVVGQSPRWRQAAR